MTVNLTSKINAKLNELARDTARDQRFGASIVDIRANVIPQEMNPDIFTIRTVVRLDSSDLDLEFNGGGGKLLPQGGYTVTVDLPYRYKTHDGDNLFDVSRAGVRPLQGAAQRKRSGLWPITLNAMPKRFRPPEPPSPATCWQALKATMA